MIGFRIFFFIVVFLLPWAGLGWIFWGLKGLAGGGAVGATGLFWLNLCAEQRILKMHQATKVLPPGLESSYINALASAGYNGGFPRLRVFPDVNPNLLVFRVYFGSGTLLLSQGLLASLSHEELTWLIQACFKRIRHPGLPLQTICASLAGGVLKMAPQPWRALLSSQNQVSRPFVGLTAFSGFQFFLIYAFARLIQQLGSVTVPLFDREEDEPYPVQTLQRLHSKILSYGATLPSSRIAGVERLYLIDPESCEMLFPI